MALELAARGRCFVSPNPMVGAVLVKSGRVVGRGYHARYGGPHAEAAALKDAGRAARGATLYVTMEPCCFCGKTPACTDALLASGVRRVVAAMLDPHKRVHGRGVRCLRGAGVEVKVGMLGREARDLNEAYITYHKSGRPFVILKAAVTLDGMMATTGGQSQWITGPVARRRSQEMRCRADAILVGVSTVVNDDPRLTCRVKAGKRMLRVVLDSTLRTPARSRIFRQSDPVLILTASENRAKTQRLEKAGAEVVRARRSGGGTLRWDSVLSELHRRSIVSVLVEGGPTVASSALEQGVVDKLCVVHAPMVLGPGRGLGMGMKPRVLGRAVALTRVRHEVLGPDVMTEGYVTPKGRR
jgi:diaminohydroxyphosphoribosylaminopyrimidine deaminase/5-amino-6-(5-phosphoribosylamino)uracil reductase